MSTYEEAGGLTRGQRVAMWAAMIMGLFATAIAFTYKLAEFMYTLTSDDVKGFADVPVTVYLVVAVGWLLLLVWCWRTGKLTDVEDIKREMLAKEEEYDERGD